MTVVELLEGSVVVMLYLIISTTISFCTALFVTLAVCKASRGKWLPDSFYDGVVKAIFFGVIGVFVALVIFGPYHFVK